MVLDVRRRMLVMGMRRGQFGNVRMWLWIVPVEPFRPTHDTIAVAGDDPLIKIQVFPHTQGDVLRKQQLSGQLSKGSAVRDQYKCRLLDDWILLRQGVDKAFIGAQIRQHQACIRAGLGVR